MKAFFVGLWVLVVALGVSYAVASIDNPNKAAKAEAKPVLTVEKVRALSVPIISGGAVRGFIVAQFAYTADPVQAKALTVSPEVFILDEAFRAIYTDDHLDFLHLEKYDVAGLTARLAAATNKRLGADVVHDVLVQDFTFIQKDDGDK